MIHHVSIPAREPQRVATVLAELMNGKCFPFGPLEGAYMAASGDEHGTMIEVYPEQATLEVPANDDQVVFGKQAAAASLAVPCAGLGAARAARKSSGSARARAGAPRRSAAACRARSRFSMSSSSGSKTG